MKKILFVGLFMSVTLSQASPLSKSIHIDSNWSSSEHPSIFFNEYETNLFKMNSSATLTKEKTPWSDTFWPRKLGGIAYRWQIDERPSKFYSKEEVLNLSSEIIKVLSPAEKMDLLQGNYSYSFTKKILQDSPENSPYWHGICNGWAEASLKHPQRKPMTLISHDGIKIEFASSDIHALLSYYYAYESNEKTRFLGKRCRRNFFGKYVNCSGMNPAAFHLVLVESFKRKESFIIDIDPGIEVWNHPISGYSYKILQERAKNKNSAKSTVKEVLIGLDLAYAREVTPSFEGSPPSIYHRQVEYWLELDAKDQVIGGSWSTENNDLRIDFAWMREKGKLPKRYQVFLD